MHGRSLRGNREASGLARVACHRWSASGRRGAEADDERSRGVRSCLSHNEPYEQSWVTSGGARGAKGRNQGKCGSAQHMPGAGPGQGVPGAGPHTASRKAPDEGDVHSALLRKSRRDRRIAKLKEIKNKLRRRMHWPSRAGTMAEAGAHGLLCVSRCADQLSVARRLS
jgi:hypothetical protein